MWPEGSGKEGKDGRREDMVFLTFGWLKMHGRKGKPKGPFKCPTKKYLFKSTVTYYKNISQTLNQYFF